MRVLNTLNTSVELRSAADSPVAAARDARIESEVSAIPCFHQLALPRWSSPPAIAGPWTQPDSVGTHCSRRREHRVRCAGRAACPRRWPSTCSRLTHRGRKGSEAAPSDQPGLENNEETHIQAQKHLTSRLPRHHYLTPTLPTYRTALPAINVLATSALLDTPVARPCIGDVQPQQLAAARTRRLIVIWQTPEPCLSAPSNHSPPPCHRPPLCQTSYPRKSPSASRHPPRSTPNHDSDRASPTLSPARRGRPSRSQRRPGRSLRRLSFPPSARRRRRSPPSACPPSISRRPRARRARWRRPPNH